MGSVCALADPIKKIAATIASTKSVHTIKPGSPRIGFEIRDREISGQWLMDLTIRIETGSSNMVSGLSRF